LFCPQQYAAFPVVTAQTDLTFALTVAYVSDPDTAAGDVLPSVEPFPNWPYVLSPQQ
jgi:hypothetical protein